MEVFTLKEWEDNFDELLERVEKGETIGIVREDGKAAAVSYTHLTLPTNREV